MFRSLTIAAVISVIVLHVMKGTLSSVNFFKKGLSLFIDAVTAETRCNDAYEGKTSKRDTEFFLIITSLVRRIIGSNLRANKGGGERFCISAFRGETLLSSPVIKRGSSVYEDIGGTMRSFAWN